MLAHAVRQHQAAVQLSKLGSTPVDAASVLSIVGLDVRCGDVCVVTAEGPDAASALAELQTLVEARLVETEESIDQVPPNTATASSALPRSLRGQGIAFGFGRPICGGIGEGCAHVVRAFALSPEDLLAKPASFDRELSTAKQAIDSTRVALEQRAASSHAVERDLLLAHVEMVTDPALVDLIEHEIRAGRTAAQAVAAAGGVFAQRLRAAQSQYVRDRALDVQDVCAMVLQQLSSGGGGAAASTMLKGPAIVFAETLTANQLLQLDRQLLRGLVLGCVGPTSHTAILARSRGVPTVIDVQRPEELAPDGSDVLLDGDCGVVISSLTPTVHRHYSRRRRALARWQSRIASLAGAAATTADGVRLEVGASVSSSEEVAIGVEHGMDGVGLFRTEMLFLDRAVPPTEEEQFQIYGDMVAAAAGRPVIVRTFDIGADKAAPYLSMPREDNPFLGVRGLRLYERHPSLLDTQLRAIVRASARGPIKAMAPMVATPREAAWFRDRVRRIQSELATKGVSIDASMPVGVMIEIPALATVMDQLADEVDFFSIGTNDLSQYALAFDRSNGALEHRYGVHQPSFLRLLDSIVRGARARGKWIGVCGEMAGEPRNLPLMIGLGLDEISVASRDIASFKTSVAGANAGACRSLLDAALACRTSEEVQAVLRGSPWRGERSIIEPDLVEIDCDAANKEEAIRDAVEAMYLAGRASSAGAVEEAVWAREETYSTGLGHGFAIPHCKSDAVNTPTLAVLKLSHPVEWGSMDSRPVAVVLLLAMPAGETAGGGAAGHMKVFARLARRLMHEEFRDKVLGASDRESMVRLLKCELEIE